MITNKIGIIGQGFVGTAVGAGFSRPGVDILYVDPAKSHSATYEDIIDAGCVFVCVPTECNNSGGTTFDSSTVESVLGELLVRNYAGVVIIKSTLPLSFIPRLAEFTKLRIIINPEFLTERNAVRDFVDASQIVIGAADPTLYEYSRQLYQQSYVRKQWMIQVTHAEAIAYKLFMNVYLATKVSLMNEFRDIFQQVSERDWNDFTHYLKYDPRFGRTHTQAPGPDGQLGYGGKCLPASVNSIIEYATNLHIPTIRGGNSKNRFVR